MANSNIPNFTRLRYARARNPDLISEWLEALAVRVQIYGCPQWDGKAWVLWFVPDDQGADISSMDLDKEGIE